MTLAINLGIHFVIKWSLGYNNLAVNDGFYEEFYCTYFITILSTCYSPSINWFVGMNDEDMSLTIKCLDRMLHKRKQVCHHIHRSVKCNVFISYMF